MQQWLVGDAVGGVLTVGDGSAWTLVARDASIPVVGEPSVSALQSSSGDIGGMMVAAVVLVVLGLGGVAAWHSGLPSLRSTRGASESEPTTEPDRPATTESPPEPDQPATEPDEPAGKTDSELIVDILEANEGRMKQARIVDETGWSKSKVSMLLSEMEEDEEISKLRVGRENIISLSGNEPEAAGSPFDDE